MGPHLLAASQRRGYLRRVMILRVLAGLASHGLRPAVCAAGAADAALSYVALADQVRQLSSHLQAALSTRGAVLLCYPNRPPYVRAFLGVLAAGRPLLPMPDGSAPLELANAARRASVAAAIVSTDVLPKVKDLFGITRPLPQLTDDALLLSGPAWATTSESGPALLLQSSGTTDEPKIVRRDARALDAVTAAVVKACRFASDDRVLAAVPLCHSYGLEHGILAPLAAGSCVHVSEGFDPSVVLPELRAGITRLPGVPFMFEMLCRAAEGPFSSLRRVYSAGGPLPRHTFDLFRQKFRLNIGQVYGATEVGSVTFNDPDEPNFDPASVGKPMGGVSIKILDAQDPRVDRPLPPGAEGQVAVAAPSTLSGYVGENTPLVGEHFLTGDLGVLSGNGALTITGRLKLLIDVGGRKVNPAEVESILLRHPQVGQCLVVPMRVGETVCRLRAIVTPVQADAELSPQDLRRFARERLIAYKVPRVFEVRASLPTGPAGKVLRRVAEAS